MADITPRLPIELLVSALSYLSESELRRTARVSRRWRAIALEHCDLCIRFRFSHSEIHCGDLNELQTVVTYVCSNDLRLDLAVTCYDSPMATETVILANSLKDALGQLVRLSMRFSPLIPDDVYDSLRHPAPQLRQLHVAGDGDPESAPMGPWPLPIDMLGREAPNLKSLELTDISLLPRGVDAFANVQSVTVQYSRIVPRIAFRNVLPSVLDLTIKCRGNITEIGSPMFDIRGLALSRLTVPARHITGGHKLTAEIHSGDIDADESLLSELDEQLQECSPSVPVFRRYCAPGMWGEAAWERVTESLSMRVHSNCGWTEAAVVTSVSRLYRMHWFYYGDETEWDMGQPLEELNFLADRLVYVRIQNHFLPGFLQFRCNMPVLRRLQLDLEGLRNMVWPPYHNDMCYAIDLDDVDRLSPTFDEGAKGLHRLPCPALEELVITSHKRGWTVDSREAAHLGLALEQDVRPREERARLELRGVEWEGPVLDELLGLAFSTVVVSPFTADDPDGKLWDPCFD